jgi:hypothetical protein
MTALREFRLSDEDAVVAVSLRAWEPVFESLRQALRDNCFSGCGAIGVPVRPRRCERSSLTQTSRVWVANDSVGGVVGFVAPRSTARRR